MKLKTIAGVGRSGRTKNIKPKTMADWEQDEIDREITDKPQT